MEIGRQLSEKLFRGLPFDIGRSRCCAELRLPLWHVRALGKGIPEILFGGNVITSPRSSERGGEALLASQPASSPSGTKSDGAVVSSAQTAPSSGLTAPSIVPPKGGGALRGIGEKFQAIPSTGTATLEIPVISPASRGSSTPQLSLRYSSGSGNGPFGLGWSLTLLTISRKTDKGIPRYDQNDEFILSGSEDLVRCDEGTLFADIPSPGGSIRWTITRYQPRVVGPPMRIERWTSASSREDHWRVTSASNVTTVLGYRPSARISSPEDPARPEEPPRVFQWLAEEVRDDLGNVTLYEYKFEDLEGVDRRSLQERHRFGATGGLFTGAKQGYLKRIRYGNRLAPPAALSGPDLRFAPLDEPAAAKLGFCFHLVFDYGEHGTIVQAKKGVFSCSVDYDPQVPSKGSSSWRARVDPFSTCRPGFELRTYRLCRRILVFHHFPDVLGATPVCVSQQVLTYEDRQHLTRLLAFELNGFVQTADGRLQGDADQATPSLTLGYSDADASTEVPLRDERSDVPLPTVAGSAHRWVDLDGDGIAGILYAAQRNWFYRRNLGHGSLASPVAVGDVPSSASLDSELVQLLDVDSDGRLDLVDLAPPDPGYYTRIAGTGWSPRHLFEAVPTLDRHNPNLRYVDLTGDGLADILITQSDALVWLHSRGKDGYERAVRRMREVDDDKGPVGLFDDGRERLFLADMNGDGLADLVRIRNGSVCYWPSLGYGMFGAKVTMAVPDLFDTADAFDTKRMRLCDVDGSGTIDLIYLHADHAAIYANLSGNAFATAPLQIAFPRVDNLAQIDVLDVLGRGTACLVWSSPLAGQSYQAIRVIDVMGGVKPHLLTTVDNGFGGVTRIEYTTSTLQCLADRAAGRSWLTVLPFPVHVVAKVTRTDQVAETELVTRYAYRHGYFDGLEREFRGFGFVEQFDAETLPAPSGPSDEVERRPPAVTRTWFHTGAWLEGTQLEAGYAAEYCSADPAAVRLPDTRWPPEVPSWELRDLVRALKNQPLRMEVYAFDADKGQQLDPRPYTVVEHAYAVRLLQPSRDNQRCVVRADVEQTLNYHYERDLADPRVTHEFVLERDPFGNPLRQATVAYPRRRARADDPQGRGHALVTSRWMINDAQAAERFRIGSLAAECRHEIVALPFPADDQVFDLPQLREVIKSAALLPWSPVGSRSTSQAGLRLLGATTHRFWSDDLKAPLPVGEAGLRALPCDQLALAFDDASLREVFPPDDDVAGIIQDHAQTLGYTRLKIGGAKPGYVEIPSDEAAWWRTGPQVQPDPGHFYRPRRFLDPFGAATALEYDPSSLILVATIDPRQNKCRADIDYRVLAARRIVDPNGNQSAFAYEPNGKLQRVALLGKGEGDTLDEPTLEYRYAMRAMADAQPQPSHVVVWEREQHVNARAYRNDQRRQRVEYTDGSGREALTMHEAEAGPVPVVDESGRLRLAADGRTALTIPTEHRWVGTGRTVYDNKGNPVRKYEPFFWPSNEFPADPALRQWGVSPALHYDPLSRLARTDNPDGTCACIAFSAWHVERWDEVDTVLGAPVWAPAAGNATWLARMEAGTPVQRDAAAKTRALAGTPQIEHLDSLGRVVRRTTSELDPRPAQAKGEPSPYEYVTRHDLDIEGREWAVSNAESREAVRRVFDMLGRPLLQKTPESGNRWTLLDAADQPAYAWSDRGLRWRVLFDRLHRPTHRYIRWPAANDGRDPLRPLRYGSGTTLSPTAHRGKEVLADRLYYGEDMLPDEASAANLLGRVTSHFDGAGHQRIAAYDFKGNVVDQRRQLRREHRAHADWSVLANITDHAQAVGTALRLLEQREYTTTTSFDARNRVVARQTPDKRTVQPVYNAAGLLEALDVAEPDGVRRRRVVDNIVYNARGQRIRMVLGERRSDAFQLLTRYSYDPLTFRLQELYSWRDGLGANPYQRKAYTYDAAGNITSIEDTTSNRTFAWKDSPGIVEGGSRYTYDALYQLIEATGRELPSEPGAQNDPLADIAPHPGDLTRLRAYIEQYQYDRLGNLTRTRHTAGASAWVRAQSYDLTHNRLDTVSSTGAAFEHEHDAHGNLLAMQQLALMEWSADDQLLHTARNAQQHVWFDYDASGQRVRKVFEADGSRDETIYIDGYELRTRTAGRRSRTTSTLHVMDGQQRVAMLESVLSDDFGELERGTGLRYVLADHLGSASVECDETGAVIAYEEFRPFGTTAFASNNAAPGALRRRYRFTGKERDEETGLHYFGARYYAPWLSRWISSDPMVVTGGRPPWLDFRGQAYVYVNNRPTVANDPDGQVLNLAVGLGGAAIGAAIGAGIDIGAQFASGAKSWEDINVRSVFAAAAGGAVSGALAGATFGASLVAEGAATGVAIAAYKAVGAGAADAVAGATSRAVLGESGGAIAKGAPVDFAIGFGISFATVGALNSKTGAKVFKSIAESPLIRSIESKWKSATRLLANERGSIELGVEDRISKGARGGETASTAAGRKAHANYGTALGDSFDTRVSLPSGKRPDAVNWEALEVRELKPDNPRAIARGWRQVEGYRKELEEMTGQIWTSIVDTYRSGKK